MIDAARVAELHRAGLALNSQDVVGAPQPGCVERSIGAADSAAYYTSASTDEALSFAASLLFYLSKNHCFPDGNKRVAWMAMQDVLLQKGVRVCSDDVEAESFVLAIVAGEVHREDVVVWVADRLGSA